MVTTLDEFGDLMRYNNYVRKTNMNEMARERNRKMMSALPSSASASFQLVFVLSLSWHIMSVLRESNSITRAPFVCAGARSVESRQVRNVFSLPQLPYACRQARDRRKD